MNLAQAKLREQVEELVEKLKSRLGSVDPNFNKIADSLPKAIQEMKEAEGDLRSLKADEALQPEQRALKILQDAEQTYEVQVAMRKLQESADAMRRAAANGSRDGGAQANEALNRLREAQQRLERNQGGRGDRDLQQLQKNAEQLAQDQKDIANDVKALDDQQGLARLAKAQSLA